MKRSTRAHPALAMIVAAVGAAMSCATGLRVPAGIDAERLLPSGALAYLALDRQLTTAMVGAMGFDADDAQAVLTRTDRVVLAIEYAPDGQAVLFGLAQGSYPSALAGAALTKKAGWLREGPGWVQSAGALRLAFAGSRLAILGTAPLSDAVERAKAPGPHPIPDNLRDAWGQALAFYLARPGELLARYSPLGAGALPIVDIMLSARLDGLYYQAELAFSFIDDSSARVYQPLCRLLMLGLGRLAWPDDSGLVMAKARWTVLENRVSVSGMSMDMQQAEALLKLLAGPALSAGGGSP